MSVLGLSALVALMLLAFGLAGWVAFLAMAGCYRAMRRIATERQAEVVRLRANHDERLAQLRADREARAFGEQLRQLKHLEHARRAVAPSAVARRTRYGSVSLW